MRYVITKSKLCLKLFNEADDSDYSICVCIFLSIIYLSNVETAYVAGGVFGPLFIRPIFVMFLTTIIYSLWWKTIAEAQLRKSLFLHICLSPFMEKSYYYLTIKTHLEMGRSPPLSNLITATGFSKFPKQWGHGWHEHIRLSV